MVVLAQLWKRFHVVARQLRSRREARPTLNVHDEYDAQDLLHALLFIQFEDVRAEDRSRGEEDPDGLGAKELGTQLIDDIGRYQSHPDRRALVCFVYDPEGLVANPRGLEADLSRDAPFPVRVYIRPI
jgi:hypothetical protein